MFQRIIVGTLLLLAVVAFYVYCAFRKETNEDDF